ncbi:MAG TPA: hypothetical protein VFT74_22205 [Isosphaeraceae bacterium]|nr:hypothetical protein [Isosphaeraceae bacterium]
MSLTSTLPPHAGRPSIDTPLSRLAQEIEGQIMQRAAGRIRDLRVECLEGLVILEGRARTYHAKQLAQEAVLDLLEDAHSLLNNIVVF